MSNTKCDVCGARWGLGDNQWVSVEDSPKDGEDILVCVVMFNSRTSTLPEYRIFQAKFDKVWDVPYCPPPYIITHWMPLPKPPEE
jgi:hypothetical protein